MTNLVQYHPKSIAVELLDTPYEMGGVKLVAVRAVEGKPFVGGEKWPVRTEFAVVRLDELTLEEAPSIFDEPEDIPEEADPFSPCLHQGTVTTHEEFDRECGPCDWESCDDCGARLS